MKIVSPPGFRKARGFSHGVLYPGGRPLFIAGQTAPPGTFVEQFEKALAATVAVVREAGGAPEHIGTMTIFVTSIDEYLASLKPLGPVYRKHMGKHYPAMALVQVVRLVDPGAKLEIQSTAVLP